MCLCVCVCVCVCVSVFMCLTWYNSGVVVENIGSLEWSSLGIKFWCALRFDGHTSAHTKQSCDVGSNHTHTHTHTPLLCHFFILTELLWSEWHSPVLWDIWLSVTCWCPSLSLASPQSPPGCTILHCSAVSPTSWHCLSVFTPALLCPDVAFLFDAGLTRTH